LCPAAVAALIASLSIVSIPFGLCSDPQTAVAVSAFWPHQWGGLATVPFYDVRDTALVKQIAFFVCVDRVVKIEGRYSLAGLWVDDCDFDAHCFDPWFVVARL
jgi:hypothetical protein